MEGIISTLIFLLVCVTLLAVTTWRKCKNTEILKEWVAWSVCENDGVRYNKPLCEHLKSAQHRINIAEQYRIKGDAEWEIANKIIDQYKKSLVESYFNDQLWVLKGKIIYSINSMDYFIFMLYVYLCEHDRYEKNIVFHKMQYLTYMYCKSSFALQKSIPIWNESRLKEVLDADMLYIKDES